MAFAQGPPSYDCTSCDQLAAALRCVFGQADDLRFARRGHDGPPMQLLERDGEHGRFAWREGSGLSFTRWIPIAQIELLEAPSS